MSFRILVFFISIVLLSACVNEPKSEEINQVEPEEIAPPEEVVEEDQWIPQYEVLPSCEINIDNETFLDFYHGLLRSCLDYDSMGIVAAIHDSVRFSQYECYDDHWLVPENCDNCIRCSKEGIIKGVFGRMDRKQMADRLFHLLTYYGISSFNDINEYMLFQPIEGAYSNYKFKDPSIQEGYFRYGYILPKRKEVAIYQSMDVQSEQIGVLPYKAIPYENEVGMGEYVQNDPDTRWLTYENGFIIAEDVTSGFDYTLILFEKTGEGWRITGFFEPPGC